MGPGQSRERSARAAALWLLVIGFVASAMVSLAPASFLQARLRFGCRLSGVGWVCDDQAALLWPAIGGTLLGALALGGVALLIRATWDRARLRAEWLGSIALIGVLPTVVLSLLLLGDAIAHDASGVALDASRVAMWAERAMLSALASRDPAWARVAHHYGDPTADEGAAARIRAVMRGSGALAEVERRIDAECAAVKELLDAAPIEESLRAELTTIVGRCAERGR